MILDTSSGIEPQFSLVFVKNVMDGEKLLYVNKWLEDALEAEGLLDKALLDEISQTGRSLTMIRYPKPERCIPDCS
jgi:ribonucleoside-diphosphate reductase alpha chain